MNVSKCLSTLTNELYNNNIIMKQSTIKKDLFLDVSEDEKSFEELLLEAEYNQLVFIKLLLLMMQDK